MLLEETVRVSGRTYSGAVEGALDDFARKILDLAGSGL